MSGLLLRGGEVDGVPADVLVAAGQVVATGPDLAAPPEAEVLDVGGGAVLPGLHDHHVHLLAMAAARRSLDVRDVVGPEGFDAAIRDAPGSGSLRVVGYHEHHHGPLDRRRLDRLAPYRPVRVQHAGGAAWVLNARAGGIGEGDDGWLFGSPAADPPPTPGSGRAPVFSTTQERVQNGLDLAEVGAELLALGVTGVTDATPFTDPGGPRLLAEAVERGDLPQQVVVTGGLDLADDGRLARGPVKLIIADHEVPDLGRLTAAIRTAHGRGRPVAVHCVTATAMALLLAAWADAGAHEGDRVEHGAVVDPAAALALADLGVTVVTQPNFVAERGDRYLAEVDPVDRPHLWPCGSLLDAGVAVAAGTDAPFGLPDPWAAMAAAVDRRTAAGAVLGADERIAAARALDLFLGSLDAPGGPPRRVEVGAPADLCVLDRPLRAVLDDLADVVVAATIVGGRPRFTPRG